MSKSLKRVRAVLEQSGCDFEIREVGAARTALEAAAAAGCAVNQIVKSIIFRGQNSDAAHVFLTAGGNQVDPVLAAQLANEPLIRADADFVRAQTGFAIGGVAPIGHISPTNAPFMDNTFFSYDIIWAAAGTPRHIFRISPRDLFQLSNAQTADFIC